MTQRCKVCEELSIQYLLALDELKAARQELAFAVTLTQLESAKARLSRVQSHLDHARAELAGHSKWATSRNRSSESSSTCGGSTPKRAAA